MNWQFALSFISVVVAFYLGARSERDFLLRHEDEYFLLKRERKLADRDFRGQK